MEIRRRPLLKKERQELEGIVSLSTTIGRAVLFLVAVGLLAYFSRGLNRLTPAFTWWPYATAAAAVGIFVFAKHGTGGPELRRQIRQDLAGGEIEERVYTLDFAIVYPEVEDEGPVWLFREGSKTYCLSGQQVDRLARDGQPRSTLIATVAPASGRLLKLKVTGEKPPIHVSPTPFHASPGYDPGFLEEALQEVSADLDRLAGRKT